MPIKRTRNGHSKSNNKSNGKSTSKFKRGKPCNKAKPNGNGAKIGNGNAKMGRPTKFNAEAKRAAEYMAKKGWTNDEMAEALGITTPTLYNWKKAHPDFFKAIKDWKDHADRKVVRTLYECARGYDCIETKVHFTSTGTVITKDIIKHYKPDVAAQIMWLKNRTKNNPEAERWRDQIDYSQSPDSAPIEVTLSVDLLSKMDAKLLKLFQKFLSKVA